jgi:hypothetical protein
MADYGEQMDRSRDLTRRLASALSQSPSALRQRLAVAALLALLPLLYFYPAALGQLSLVPGDGWTQNLGVRVLIGQMIAQGTLPLWNPYIFAGTPLLASIYPGALYPPNWLFALFSPGVAINLVVITTFHLALIGSYLYARCIGAGRAGALITGIAFTFGAYMVFHLGHTSRIAAAAWLPWIMLALESLYQRASWRWIALGALFVALQLYAGEPQMNCYTVIVAGAYGLFSLTVREEQERRGRFAAAAVVMAVCGALLSAMQLLPEQELLQQGERARISYEYFAGYSLPPAQTLALIFPFFFGGAIGSPYQLYYWGQWGGETFGYAGLLTVLLSLIAVLGPRRPRLAWFWAGMAVLSLLLAFGSYLPFQLNQALYQVPVYNLFRVLGRHMFEFTFSLAVLAGLGASYVAQMERDAVWCALRRATAVFAALIAGAVIIYRFFGPWLETTTPRPPRAESLTNAEALVPLACSILSVAALWFYARRKSALASAALVAVLLADLVSFGHFLEWRTTPHKVNALLPDPPSVQFIKAREPDLASFRILSHALWPYDYNYEMLNHPNVSIARGLQSANGYDALRLPRLAAVAGEMSIDGVVQDLNSFSPSDQGFNLLNVKYLLRERRGPLEAGRGVFAEGVPFSEVPINLMLGPGARREVEPGGVAATELALVSTMGRATHLPDGAPVLAIKLHTTDGRVIARELQAGRDTAEWAYDRPDVRAAIKHQRPRVAESWNETGFAGHRYLARLPFARAEITRIEFDYLREDAELHIVRASLFDATTGQATPLDSVRLSPERWRKLASFGAVEVYENLQQLPRAWFVSRLHVAPSAEVLRAIKEGRLSEELLFDPAQTALLETEDFGGRPVEPPPVGDASQAEVRITRYEAHRIELTTRNPQPGFLVLSEVYYRGWDARVDGEKQPVYRANYALRGLAVPPGEHRVEFIFRAPTFYNGAVYSALGALILLAGAVASRIGTKTRFGARAGGWLRSRGLIVAAVVGLLSYSAVLAGRASEAVGGADSAGYATLARSMLKGEIASPITTLESLGLPESFSHLFTPLGYTLGPRPQTMVTFYPVGFPLHLAAAALIGGWEKGPFVVSPLLAALSLILIYLVGRELGLPRGWSLAGAAMLAASPTFVFMALQPMGDLAATCWALGAIFAALRSRQQAAWAIAAGAAFGLGVLVRPTNIFLAVPLLFSLRLDLRTLWRFLLGGLPFAGIFFAYNTAAYGHPWQTGYAAINLQTWVTTQNFTARFTHYLYWLGATLSPLLLLGWLGVAVNRRMDWKTRALLLTWFGVVLFFYAGYGFYEAWWYTRFLLPGMPALILGALLAARDAASYLQRFSAWRNRANLRWAVGVLLLLVVFGFELRALSRFDVLRIGEAQATHPASSRWADRVLPSQSLVVAGEMSGALKFYTERYYVRWDQVGTPEQWQLLKQHAAERGYRWYALLMPHEIELAQRNLPGSWTNLGEYRQVSLWQIEPVSEQLSTQPAPVPRGLTSSSRPATP